MAPTQILEATMLACFGLAWPLANLRMLRTRRAEGRGLAPTSLVLCGYGAGILAKLLACAHGAALPPVFWMYLLNAASVGLNIALQWRFRRAASVIVAHPSAAEGDRDGPLHALHRPGHLCTGDAHRAA